MNFKEFGRVLFFVVGAFCGPCIKCLSIADEAIMAEAVRSFEEAKVELQTHCLECADHIPNLRVAYDGVSIAYLSPGGAAHNAGLSQFLIEALKMSSQIAIEGDVAQVEVSASTFYIDPEFLRDIILSISEQMACVLAEKDEDFYCDGESSEAVSSASLLKQVLICFIKTVLLQWKIAGVPLSEAKNALLISFLFNYLKTYYFPICERCEAYGITDADIEPLNLRNKEIVNASVNDTYLSFFEGNPEPVADGTVFSMPVARRE